MIGCPDTFGSNWADSLFTFLRAQARTFNEYYKYKLWKIKYTRSYPNFQHALPQALHFFLRSCGEPAVQRGRTVPVHFTLFMVRFSLTSSKITNAAFKRPGSLSFPTSDLNRYYFQGPISAELANAVGSSKSILLSLGALHEIFWQRKCTNMFQL